MPFLKTKKCHSCGKAITEKQDVRVQYTEGDFRDSSNVLLIHKDCLDKILTCCVCGDACKSTYRGVGGDKFPVCQECRDTIVQQDDLMGEGRKEVIKEAKRLIFGEE